MGNQPSNDTGNRNPFGRVGTLGLSRQELDKRCQPSGYVGFGFGTVCPWVVCSTSLAYFSPEWTSRFRQVSTSSVSRKFLLSIRSLLVFCRIWLLPPILSNKYENHSHLSCCYYCHPYSLYNTCHWEDRAIRKLVGDGKAAARCKGAEFRTADADHECPICFLYYPEVNVTKCCNANLCTECFLQVRPQKEKHSVCPFCNHLKLNISVARKLSEQEILDRDIEEKRAVDARIRSRDGCFSNNGNSSKDEGEEDGSTKSIKIPASNGDEAGSSASSGFGSSLEQDSRVVMARKRSESFASSEHSGQEGNSLAETSMIQSMAMTPEERRRLEAEMRNQSLHPLALQLEAEAEQRRSQNERNYHRTHSDRRSAGNNPYHGGIPRSSCRGPRATSSAGAPRDWNQIVEAFERSGHGAINSLDDLVVLEAAILLSMEEEARRGSGGDNDSENDGDHHAGDDGEDFGAARHAREGFPLVRSFLASRGRDEEPATRQQVQSLARSLNSSRRRNQLLQAGLGSQSARNMPDSAMDTASFLLRGLSEEDQMAMAIAASLQDQNNDNNASETAGPAADEGTGGGTAAPTAAAEDGAEAENADLEAADVGIMAEEPTEQVASDTDLVMDHGDQPAVPATVTITDDGGDDIPNGLAIGAAADDVEQVAAADTVETPTDEETTAAASTEIPAEIPPTP